MSDILYSRMDSPIGELLLRSEGEQLTGLFMRTQNISTAKWQRNDVALKPACRQLTAYFAGELKDFDLPMRGHGTPFQETVWTALCDIPYGETLSYGELARRIGQPTAARAVGLANGQNPISIIVPCHRVIGANGKLTGYGGGLPNKQWLLAHEAGNRGRDLFS